MAFKGAGRGSWGLSKTPWRGLSRSVATSPEAPPTKCTGPHPATSTAPICNLSPELLKLLYNLMTLQSAKTWKWAYNTKSRADLYNYKYYKDNFAEAIDPSWPVRSIQLLFGQFIIFWYWIFKTKFYKLPCKKIQILPISNVLGYSR